jgi:hypothetical protein
MGSTDDNIPPSCFPDHLKISGQVQKDCHLALWKSRRVPRSSVFCRGLVSNFPFLMTYVAAHNLDLLRVKRRGAAVRVFRFGTGFRSAHTAIAMPLKIPFRGN